MASEGMDGTAKRKGAIARLWDWIKRPSGTIALGTLVSGGIMAGILFWGGFHWAMELTNTETFCIGCHEMKNNVFAEYRNTVHYSNRSGVRASCPDCHVPKDWQHKIVRKIQASNELFHHFMGTVDTGEKFDAKRIQLARNEWKRMKTTDSRECRNCHKFDFMDYKLQEPRASKTHQEALTGGKTCIDCHRGIAHKLPPNAKEEYDKLMASMAEEPARASLVDYLLGASAAHGKPAQ